MDPLFLIINKYEKQYLESNGTCSDKVWFVGKKKIEEDMEIQITEDSLSELFFAIGLKSFRLKSSKTVFVVEINMRKFEKDQKEQLLYALQNYDTERPNVYPESMRTHCLQFIILNNKDESVRAWFHNVKSANNKIEFDGEMYSLPAETGFGMPDQMIQMYINGYQFARQQQN